ncbi:MAG: hypothetical protein QOD02_675 [Mycobacterium sp.]|jgi:hypothetical protein|nr:hypothetical protein [Mycobacterium sp.]MDT5199551.1 hypothetical protein [Mycobacterium sp.]MDT5306094.1 hypothetical protein [Mycobacterium sp.]
MRAHNTDGSSRPVAAAAVLTLSAVVVFAMAGCGPKNNNTVPSTSPGASSTAAPSTTSTGAQFDIGNTINYVSTGTTTTLDCGDGKSLNVGGFNNTLTVRGTCGTVSIGGGDNKITVDKIDKQLNVVGSHNAISYKDGDPKVENLGSGNTINKAG